MLLTQQNERKDRKVLWNQSGVLLCLEFVTQTTTQVSKCTTQTPMQNLNTGMVYPEDVRLPTFFRPLDRTSLGSTSIVVT